MSKPIELGTRTYRYEHPEYGALQLGQPEKIQLRIKYNFDGYSISFRYLGQGYGGHFQPWPGTRGKRFVPQIPEGETAEDVIWAKLEAHSQIQERVA